MGRTLIFILGRVDCTIRWSKILGVTLDLCSIDVARMPHEVLEELVCVFCLDHDTSSLDDIFGILDEFTAFGAELLDRYWRVV